MLTFQKHYLTNIIEPKSIAVVGASDRANSVGGKVLKNLLQGGYEGQVVAVNPKHRKIQGKVCYPSLNKVPEPIDLAVITIPAEKVPETIMQCGESGIHNAIILSAGFSEIGSKGQKIEKDLLAIANKYKIQFIGPNCLGVMRPSIHMNATFDNNFAEEGHIALVSQSGAICAGILDWAVDKKIGFSAIISVGNSAYIDLGDVLDYLAVDEKTKSILLYIEGVHHARGFMSGLRAAACIKPVIVIKAGRLSMGSRAALSHTGAMIGNDQVFEAALRRAGAIRVYSIEELFLATEILASKNKVTGNRLAIITNGGGAGVLAADMAQELNLILPSLEKNIEKELDKVLPPHWSHQNPIDIIGDASPERYHKTLDICSRAKNIDGILIILVPVAMSNPLAVAKQVITDSKQYHMPILTCWMGEKQVLASWKIFDKHQIPCFATPEHAVKAFAFSAKYAHHQMLLSQIPSLAMDEIVPDINKARCIINKAFTEKRRLLSTLEAKELLEAFSIPVVKTVEVTHVEDAIAVSSSIGYPIVMKVNSPDISHKQDVGGIELNIGSPEEVRIAFDRIISNVKKSVPEASITSITIERMVKSEHNRELMIGVLKDSIFGPVISFGMGGSYVEIVKDQALEFPPFNAFLAEQMIARTKIAKSLSDFRNMLAVDTEKIVSILIKVSEMVCQLPEIEEMDINPLIVNNHEAIVVDARFVLSPSQSSSPYEHVAIHPIPLDLCSKVVLRDNSLITIRPIKPEDAKNLQQFFSCLSPESKYFRFFKHFNELNVAMLVRLTQVDYYRDMALIALNKEADEEVPIGVAHYFLCPDSKTCEFGLVISDAWQKKGVGVQLLTRLLEIASARGIHKMVGMVLSENEQMLELARYLGFSVRPSGDDFQLNLITKQLARG
jgi:acetyltransferase